MYQQRNTIPHTIMSHMTHNPRLALKTNDAGELVPSMNLEGTQDAQVAGTITSIEAGSGYVNPVSNLTYYKGKALVNFGVKGEAESSVLFAGKSIDKIKVGNTYWMTIRKSKDGNLTNLSCGGLSTDVGLDASFADSVIGLLQPISESSPVAATA